MYDVEVSIDDHAPSLVLHAGAEPLHSDQCHHPYLRRHPRPYSLSRHPHLCRYLRRHPYLRPPSGNLRRRPNLHRHPNLRCHSNLYNHADE